LVWVKLKKNKNPNPKTPAVPSLVEMAQNCNQRQLKY